MKRILSIFLLLAVVISAFAAFPVLAADASVTSAEGDSIVPYPWETAEISPFSSAFAESAASGGQVLSEEQPTEQEVPTLPFTDVKPGTWYYNDVVYAYQNSLMLGVSDTEFAPLDTLTRAQMVTVLYRLEGSPKVSGSSGFSDVPDGVFYTDAVTWAAQNGIVQGVTTTAFHPKDNVTREQVVAIFYRYYGGYKQNNTAAPMNLSRFHDSGSISGYAKAPMNWAVLVGLIQGTNASNEAPRLSPKGTSNRAQIATLLTRMAALINPSFSPEILDFIKEREGFSRTPYWDYQQFTIGYGTCCGYSKEEVPEEYWNGITPEEAETLLRASIASNYAKSVSQYEARENLDFTQGQFDALVSFTFNLGAGWTKEECMLTNWLENPTTDLQLVWSMGVWCRAGGSILTGLCTRRIRESEIFLYNDYSGTESHPSYCYVKYTGAGSLLTVDHTDDVGYYVLGNTYGELPSPVWTPSSKTTTATASNTSSRTFVGWFTEDGMEITSSSIVQNDQTLTAHWKDN